MKTLIKIGTPAPDFRGMAIGGKYGEGAEVTLADYRAKPLVLYFYPKDDTPGCTAQASDCAIGGNEIQNRAEVLGVSIDSESHAGFIKKFRLPFPLLADPARKIVTAYGVWVKKNFLERNTWARNAAHLSSMVRDAYRPSFAR